MICSNQCWVSIYPYLTDFHLAPLSLFLKKVLKWPKISNFMEIKPLWNFLKFWTANLFLYRHIRFLFTISIHQNWMIYRTFYRKLCWFEPLSILPRLTMIVAVLYAVKFRIRLSSHFLFYLNDDLPSFLESDNDIFIENVLKMNPNCIENVQGSRNQDLIHQKVECIQQVCWEKTTNRLRLVKIDHGSTHWSPKTIKLSINDQKTV